MDIRDILNFKIIHLDRYSLTVYQLVLAVLILFLSKFIVYVSRNIIGRKLNERVSDKGKAYALFQLFSYFFWILAFVIILDVLNIQMTYLLAGSAALFVGLGLGLQDVFKDIAAGIFMLMERNVNISDVMEVEGTVGRVTHIGMRTSILRTRDGISMIVPNSRFINEKVINWSNESEATRFSVEVGVAYGTNEQLVKQILLEIAGNTAGVINDTQHPPIVRLVNFGDSSLDFQLLFWSRDIFPIENTRSAIRFSILEAFRKHKVTIPFPQRDVHLNP